MAAPGWDATPWDEAAAVLDALPLTEYGDVNLVDLVDRPVDEDTIEVRMLPVHREVAPIIAAAELFGALVDDAVHGGGTPVRRSVDARRRTRVG